MRRAHAAEHGAGTLVYVGPLRPRRIRRGARARRAAAHGAARRSMPAWPRSPMRWRRMRRRRSRSTFDWPDAIQIDGGLVGGGQLAWPDRRRKRAAGLAGVRRHDPHRLDGRGRAGPASAVRGARGRRLRRFRLRRGWSRASRAISWCDRRLAGEGFAAVAQGLSAAPAPRERRAPRHRRQWRSAGAAHGQGRGRAAQACAGAGARRRGSIPTTAAEGRGP